MPPSDSHPRRRWPEDLSFPGAELCLDKSVWGEHANLSPNPQFLKAKNFLTPPGFSPAKNLRLEALPSWQSWENSHSSWGRGEGENQGARC